MKCRLLTLLICILSAVGGYAQVAKWLIPPMYDDIGFVQGLDAVYTDSAGIKSIWDFNGKRLFSTPNQVFPYREGMSVSTVNGSNSIAGVYKEDGSMIKLAGCHVVHQYPFYSDGRLLVLADGTYQYVDKSGAFLDGKYADAYPFFNGFAVCDMYEDAKKQKGLRHYLLNVDGAFVPFSYNGKDFDVDDVGFVSSVNDAHIGVVVIKRKVYIFSGTDKTLSPVFIDDNADGRNLKEQARTTSGEEQYLTLETDSTFTLQAQCGKNGMVVFRFDKLLRPVSVKKKEQTKYYEVNKVEERKRQSLLKKAENAGSYGICWESTEVLPPQFDKIKTCFDNKAMVSLNGHYGLLEVVKNDSFQLRLNKGDNIAFRHQKFETTIRLDLPTFVSANTTKIEIDPQSGCELDKTSKQGRDTESGNFVQYDCELKIPNELPDELTEISYPVTVMYDGLVSPVIQLKTKAWHFKYFVVNIDESQISLENRNVSFVFNIDADRIVSDGVYHNEVDVLTDSLSFELEKITETRYKCKVLSLHEGVNNIAIEVIEQGCPPATFPFEVEYHRPLAKTRNTTAAKEHVVIKKKPKAVTQKVEPVSRPRVEM